MLLWLLVLVLCRLRCCSRWPLGRQSEPLSCREANLLLACRCGHNSSLAHLIWSILFVNYVFIFNILPVAACNLCCYCCLWVIIKLACWACMLMLREIQTCIETFAQATSKNRIKAIAWGWNYCWLCLRQDRHLILLHLCVRRMMISGIRCHLDRFLRVTLKQGEKILVAGVLFLVLIFIFFLLVVFWYTTMTTTLARLFGASNPGRCGSIAE